MSGSSYLAPLSSVLLMMMMLAAPGAKAYPNGAPVQQCLEMTPKHRGIAPQPNEAPPFVLTTSKANYSAEEIITVTIRSRPPTMFRGLLLQARDSSSRIVGTFMINPNSAVKPLACNDMDNTAVTHTSRTDKSEVSVSWKAPMPEVGDVTFRATVVQNFSTFYVRLSSAPITYMDNNMKNNNMNNNNDNNNMNNNNDNNNMNNNMGDMTKDDMGGMNEDDMMRGGGGSTGVSVTSTVVVFSVTLLLNRLL